MGQNELTFANTNAESMSTKEVAEALGCHIDTVNSWVKKLYPTLSRNGVRTILDQAQVTAIKKAIETSGRSDLRNVTQLKNVHTDLEMIQKSAEVIQWAMQKIQDMTPAYEFGSYLIESTDKWLSMSEAAAILSTETGLGRNNLFAWLRGQKILMANNVPYREYIDRGYFNVTEKSTPVGPKTVTIVSNAGMAWILKQYKLSN